LPAAKLRRRNSSSGSIGWAVVASREMKSAKKSTPPRPGTRTSGALQPDVGWRISASVGPARARNDSAAPGQSIGTRARPGSRPGTPIATRTSVAITNGTLTAKIQRHDAASISCPPTSGPTTVAMPDHAVHEPTAAPRCAGGNAVTITASALGIRSAPKTPCAIRPATRTSMVGAAAQTIDVRPNPSTPTEKTRRSPSTSPSEPPTRMSAASASV
jgi:hypothetical protein